MANDSIIKENVSELLLDAKVVSISLTHPFKYASGMESPIYTNCRKLSSYPNERDEIIEMMVKRIGTIQHDIDKVVSSGTSSIFIASLIADRLKVPFAYVRPEAKRHGKMKKIEGVFKKGDRVLLVSDIISTENDIPNSIKTIQENGGIIVLCVSIFSNNLGKIEKILKEQNIPVVALTNLKNLLKVATKKGYMSLDEKNAIKEWLKSPEDWNEKRRMKTERVLEKNKKKIARILLKIGAVTINVKQPFRYTSGILSPIYTDNRLLISYLDKWPYIINSYVKVIEDIIGLQNVDIIAGTATSGIPHANLIAARLGLPMIYVRLEHDETGENGYIEGEVKKGDRIVIIEDHVTTGKSVLSTLKVLRKAGAVVDWCIAIFTYDTVKSKSTFEKEQINFLALSDLPTLLKTAIKMKYIQPEEEKVVLDWLENPEGWSKQKNNIAIKEDNGSHNP